MLAAVQDRRNGAQISTNEAFGGAGLWRCPGEAQAEKLRKRDTRPAQSLKPFHS
jgi:hypothetical protein